MAKTDFEHGTTVTSDFLDTIYRTSGGHRHDGVDDDGHAGKIQLTGAAEVTGMLPISNVALASSFLSGGKCCNHAANDYTIKVEPCYALAANDVSRPIQLQTYFLKKIQTGGFVAGDNECGVANAVSFNVDDILHVFLISNETIGVDIGIDSNENAANLISELGGLYYRRISSVKIKSLDGINGNIYNFTHFGDRYIYHDGGFEIGPIYTLVDADFYDQGGGIYHAWTPMVIPWIDSRSIEVIYDILPTAADGVSVIVVPNNLTAYQAYLATYNAWMSRNIAGSKTIITKRFIMEDTSAHLLVKTDGLPGSISIMVRGYIDKRI